MDSSKKIDALNSPFSALEKLAVSRFDEERALLRWRSLAIPGSNHFADFSSNDYFGLACKSIQALFEESHTDISKIICGQSGSRLVTLNTRNLDVPSSQANWLDACETFFSKSLGSETALVVPSAFIANCCVFEALAWITKENKTKIEVFADVYSHGSIYTAAKNALVPLTLFKHLNLDHLKRLLEKSNADIKILYLEGLHSMWGSLFPLEQLTKLVETFKTHIIWDEAHSFGVIGKAGLGVSQSLASLQSWCLAKILGGGKALGVSGGIILGPKFMQDAIVQGSSFFKYTTGTPPIIAAMLLANGKTILSQKGDELRKRLQNNITLFKALYTVTEKEALNHSRNSDYESPIIPIEVGDNQKALTYQAKLNEAGLRVIAMRPPTVPKNRALLRIVLHATHSQLQIEKLVEVLKTCK